MRCEEWLRAAGSAVYLGLVAASHLAVRGSFLSTSAHTFLLLENVGSGSCRDGREGGGGERVHRSLLECCSLCEARALPHAPAVSISYSLSCVIVVALLGGLCRHRKRSMHTQTHISVYMCTYADIDMCVSIYMRKLTEREKDANKRGKNNRSAKNGCVRLYPPPPPFCTRKSAPSAAEWRSRREGKR